jgi:thiamine biosynthesis protein ThiS
MYINGNYKETPIPISVMDFVRSYKLNKHVVYITINKKAIQKDDFDETYIYDQDQVEFVFTVSGG